jgi:hypothetical protein
MQPIHTLIPLESSLPVSDQDVYVLDGKIVKYYDGEANCVYSPITHVKFYVEREFGEILYMNRESLLNVLY